MGYYCENCTCVFFEPITVEERYGTEGPWSQTFLGCPFCGVAGMIKEIGNETD